MPKRRSTWALLAALSIALAACGGSGSSGFDITAEDHLIDSVLQSQQCAPAGNLTICPVDAGPTHEPNATPTPAEGPRVDAGLGGIDSLDCALAAGGQACRIQFTFSPRGLPPDTAYRIALREIGSADTWTVSPIGVMTGSPQLPTFVTTIEVAQATPQLQLAVLVFLNPESAVSGPVASLAASGADFAFVTAPLDVAPLPAP